MDVTIVLKEGPLRGRGEGHAVDEDVVADKEGVLHGARRDDVVLKDKGHQEQADRENGTNGGDGLERSLDLGFPRGGLWERFVQLALFLDDLCLHTLRSPRVVRFPV